MKIWRLLPIVMILCFILVSSLPVFADTSADVVVTATGYICEAPGGFTVTYISDYEVGLSWSKGVDADNTMVRAAIGREPVSRADGYLVYYGDGTDTTDWVNMETLSVPIYYKSWSQSAGGIWEEGGSDTGSVEGVSMILLAFIILALGLTIATYVIKRGVLSFAAAGAWVLLGVYCYTKYVDLWDIYYALFFLSMGMVFVSALEPVIMRERKSGEEDLSMFELDEADEELKRDLESLQAERERYDHIFGTPRGRKGRNRGLSALNRARRELANAKQNEL